MDLAGKSTRNPARELSKIPTNPIRIPPNSQMEKISDILNEMKSSGFEPTRDTHFFMLRVHAKRGDIGNILSELEHLKLKDLRPRDHEILELIYDLAVNGHDAKCKHLFGSLSKGGYYSRMVSNTVNRLIWKNQDDVAYNLLKTTLTETRASAEDINGAENLLSQLNKVNRPFKDIARICFRLHDDGLHADSFAVLSRKLIDAGQRNEFWAALRERKAKGLILVEDHFQALFDSTNETDVVETLRNMIREFDVKPTTKFLQDVVLPKLDHLDPNATMNSLLAAKILTTQASLAVSYRCLQQNQLKEAADMIDNFNVYVRMDKFEPVLISALKATNDVKSYVRFLRVQFENLQRAQVNTETGSKEDIREFDARRSDDLGSTIYSTLIELDPEERDATILAILKGLVDEGVTISSKYFEQIKCVIGPSITKVMSNCLDQLASGKLELKPIERPHLKIHTRSERWEAVVSNNKTPSTAFRQIGLLKAYHREREDAKFEQLFEQLETENASIPPVMYERLMILKLEAKDVTKAVEIYDKYKAQNPAFFLFHDNVMRIVSLLIDEDKFDDALQFLAKTKRTKELKKGHASIKPYFSLLNRLAEEGREAQVNQLFDSLVENGHMLANGKLLNPLVKVHLVNGNANKAVEAFERIAKKYKLTTCKGELCKHLIIAEDWTSLEKVTAISSKVHGEDPSLIDMAFAFINCGEVERARVIFDTPNLHVGQQRIDDICQSTQHGGSSRFLEGLLTATVSCSSQFNRGPIYLNLLELYIREEKPSEALNLWVKSQKNGETVSDEFLFKLGTYLRSKIMVVPFEVPDRGEVKTRKNQNQFDEIAQKGQKLGPAMKLAKTRFIEQLGKRDPAGIRQAYQKLSEPNLIAAIHEINGKRSLYHLFEALAESADVLALERVNSLLPEKDQKGHWYESNRAKAYALSGKAQQWIDEWNKKLDQANTVEDLRMLENDFSVSGLYHVLEISPNLFEQCKLFYLLNAINY